MLSKVIRSLIQKGETEGMREKIDIFYAASRLTDKEYTEWTWWQPAGSTWWA